MKLRVLNYGINATHQSLTSLSTIWATTAISDFDALIYDPQKFLIDARISAQANGNQISREDPQGTVRACLNKHASEVLELLSAKGGVVVILLRTNDHTFNARSMGPHGTVSTDYNPYFILNQVPSSPLLAALRSLAAASGTSIIVDRTKVQPAYLHGLRGHLTFETGLAKSQVDKSIEVLAVDSVGKAVAFSVRVGKGTILFLPIPQNVDGERLGALLIESIRGKLSITSIEKPSWVDQIPVPGTEQIIQRIESLKREYEDIMQRLSVEQASAEALLKHRELLFGTGKMILEAAVRRAFQALGFEVLEDDTYAGEWDLDMTDPTGERLIGEIEGPEGSVDIQKFRQLLNYLTDEAIEGRDSKGLLIGNAFRNASPDEREEAFTEHTLRGASKHEVGLIATTELFKAVCAVLEQPEEEFKQSIRQSILNAVGPWKFARSSSIAEPSPESTVTNEESAITDAIEPQP